MVKKETSLLEKLSRVYTSNGSKEDVFGRRKATAAEIARKIGSEEETEEDCATI